MIYWNYKHWTEYIKVDPNIRDEAKDYQIFQNMEDDSYFNIHAVLAILVGFQFLRLVVAFRLNRLFGPMAKTIGYMLVDVFKFLFLFFTIFIFFQAAAMLMFGELTQYKNFDDAFNTLFAASLANYDYTIYDTMKDVNPIVGYVFITIFILVSGILLLNFLIAILSSTYSIMESRKDSLYIKEVIIHLKKHEYHRLYSSIVSAAVPFNGIGIFTVPLIM